MSKPYIPGEESKEYEQLTSAQKAEVQKETDRRFREQTGVTRSLDSANASDLELRRTWLRIRDEVIADRDGQALRHDLDLDGLTAIPEEMRFDGWNEGAQLLDTWFSRPPVASPNYTAPVTDLIKISWVLQFPRAKSVYDEILRDRIWTNDASKRRFMDILKGKVMPGEGLSSPFWDLSAAVTVVDQEWLNARPVENGLSVDGLAVALGAFVFNIAVAGKISSQPLLPGMLSMRMVTVSIEEVGIYAKDSFDFEGDQFLGWWGYRDTEYHNSDFREWRAINNAGGDFRVYSDIARIKLAVPDTVTVTIP
ncbi:DUF6402 family protein [Acidobacterium sp. S8]|uniref:DUF6402 family protein n=1 Tax=Acidobacterium sp. S8 TaxID=1641854 RepID=UPI00131E53FF|nr:DUF6402 family protein [Acidobacterium sp. S8]